MGFSCQVDSIRSLLLRLHSLVKKKARISPSSRKYSVLGSCLGRLKGFRNSAATLEKGRRRNRRRRRRRKRRNTSFNGDTQEAQMVTSASSIPSEQEAFESFTTFHPEYLETLIVDELREEEYSELQAEDGCVCLDYSGHGLFSHLQQELDSPSSSFVLSQASGDLVSMESCHAEEGTVEFDIRRRIMGFLNIQEGEYSLFFTDSKSSAFKLVGESYPFNDGHERRLFTMFDYESESVCSLEEIARRNGGAETVINARFHFPSLSVCSAEMKLQLMQKRNVWEKEWANLDEQKQPNSGKNGANLGKKQQPNSEESGSNLGKKQQPNSGKNGANLGKKQQPNSEENGANLGKKQQPNSEENGSNLGKKQQPNTGKNGSNLGKKQQPNSEENGANLEMEKKKKMMMKKEANQEAKDEIKGVQNPALKDVVPKENKGLFVFPVQSRVSGTKYSYQWMSLAQDNGWHVLLDASAAGPKDMDSLGLSLFRPDFIVTSFYKVFGSDPTGFGCLFVKNSSMSILRPSSGQDSGTNNLGMVRLVAPIVVDDDDDDDDDEVGNNNYIERRAHKREICRRSIRHAEIAFSGLVNSAIPEREGPRPDGADLSRHSQMKEDSIGSNAEAISNLSTALTLPTIHVFQGDGDCITDLATKGKIGGPLTPRSVLEESLLIEGQSSLSHNGRETSVESNRCNSGCLSPSLRRYEPGESSSASKESALTEMESSRQSDIVMPIHNPRKIDADKTKSWLSYHSHEMFGPRHRRSNAFITDPGSFSQPLDTKKNRFTLNVDNESSSFNYIDGSEDSLDFSSSLYDDDDNDGYGSDSDLDHLVDDASTFNVVRRDPEIYCRGLNHADALGLNKTNDRLGFLINWLVSSMLKLHHLVDHSSLNSSRYVPLVHVYGPKVKFERGASMAFNLFDHNGCLIKPLMVQKMARAHNISIGTGVLAHVNEEDCTEVIQCLDDELSSPLRFRVVTATLGFFTNFEDVYRLWAFVAKFLDPHFVKDETFIIDL